MNESMFYLSTFHIKNSKKTGNTKMVKEYKLGDKDEKLEYTEELKRRAKLAHINLVNIDKYETKKYSKLCKTTYVVKVHLEYSENTLKNEIRQRAKQGDFFSPIALINIVYDMVNALAYLQENGYLHGAINPRLIYIFNKGRINQITKIGMKLSNKFETADTRIGIREGLINSYFDEGRLQTIFLSKESNIDFIEKLK